MTAFPAIPNRSMRLKEAIELADTVDGIDMVWPTWGWVTTDDITVNGMIVFVGKLVFITGFDPVENRWADVTRFTDIDVSNPGPIAAGFSALEDWICDRYETHELLRFALHFD